MSEEQLKELQEYNLEYLEAQASAVELKQANKEIERLNNIIKEAREYITYWHYRNDFRTNSFTTGVKEELLEILKGSDKE